MTKSFAITFAFALSAVQCGGASSEPVTADDVELESEPSRRDNQIQTSSEIGGLDEDKVNATFEKSLQGLQRCLTRGASRVEFLGGAVSFFLKVGTDGKIQHAHLEASTLGDHATETCMLDVLKRKEWPPPVGGDVGLARKSFDFDPPNDVRPPTDWDSENVREALDEKGDAISDCKGGSRGTFTATMYVDIEGKPLAVGVTPPDEDGGSAVECLVGLLEDTTFPSPGSWPAKVTFDL